MSLIKSHKKILIKFFPIICFFIFVSLITNLHNAFAADDTSNEISKVMCNAIDLLTGGIGKTITVVIIISLGIMLLLGKVTWGVAIALVIGIGVIFGSTEFVRLLSGDSTFDCKAINGGSGSGSAT